MDLLLQAFDFLVHLDKHIADFWAVYGVWLYVLVFLIVFAETGLVVTPWLPGDSFLFVLGALAGIGGGPDVMLLLVLLFIAAVLGNTSNYWIGRWIGPKLFNSGRSRILSKETLAKTHAFYDKYGSFTLIVSRFVPLVRTFAPFVAGLGAMPHGRFQLYSVTGGALWVGLFVGAGYLFGQIPVIKNNLPLVMLAVIVLSLAPLALQMLRSKLAGPRG
ncbi:DedA family protein [Derxia lacustris]|uniref:DedA family protein n=1 Tax=Derxia lacustris TaxID=764842 RepID=UPI000A1769E7|nr:DedA family protein [Derxia lacustris]